MHSGVHGGEVMLEAGHSGGSRHVEQAQPGGLVDEFGGLQKLPQGQQLTGHWIRGQAQAQGISPFSGHTTGLQLGIPRCDGQGRSFPAAVGIRLPLQATEQELAMARAGRLRQAHGTSSQQGAVIAEVLSNTTSAEATPTEQFQPMVTTHDQLLGLVAPWCGLGRQGHGAVASPQGLHGQARQVVHQAVGLVQVAVGIHQGWPQPKLCRRHHRGGIPHGEATRGTPVANLAPVQQHVPPLGWLPGRIPHPHTSRSRNSNCSAAGSGSTPAVIIRGRQRRFDPEHPPDGL